MAQTYLMLRRQQCGLVLWQTSGEVFSKYQLLCLWFFLVQGMLG
jgi:hypothetical protein